MKSLRFVAAFALGACAAGLVAAFAPPFTLQGDGQPQMTPEEQEIMAKWGPFMTPGPEHKVLDAKIGKWNDQVTIWMTPTSKPMETTGTSEIKWILGGRFLHGTTTGAWQGQTFEGLALVAFDNLKKKYVSAWVDNMGTALVVSEGTYDPSTKTFTYLGEGPDLASGKYVPVKATERMVDADTWVAEMWGTHAKTGKMFKNMEITSTRLR